MRLEIHYADEWAALYVDGRLDEDSVGDSYLAEECAFALLGVKQVRDNAFMRGQSQRTGVAPTLDEVRAFAEQREADRLRAEEMRAEAARLLAEAKRLVGGTPNA